MSLVDKPVTAVLPVKDLGRARGFYENTLGLKPTKEMGGGVAYRCGGDSSLYIYPTEAPGSQATAAGWLVDDFDAEMEELRNKGVVFEEYDMPGLKTENGVATYEGVKGAWFKDTEGNILNIAEGKL